MIKRMLFVLFAGSIFLSHPLCALAAKGEMVEVSAQMSGYLAMPEVPAGQIVPSIILIHEWWGLNDQIKDLADQFAENGFAALAVDLYRGKSSAAPMEAHELMRGLPDDRAVEDVRAAAEFLKSHKGIDRERTGVIGWCMGGGYALKFALSYSGLRAVVMYYGKLVTDPKELEKLHAPLLGIFGEKDKGIPPESVKDFDFRLKQLGKRSEVHIYPNAGHAFANPDNKEGYEPDAAEDAWDKTLMFLKANLS